MRFSRPELAALALALAGAVACACVALRIFEAIPHLEDEFAYLWQSEVMAQGQVFQPSPPHPRSFVVPFVVDHQGKRFGKYPPGWPAALSLGARADTPWLVNPLLAGLTLWLMYRLGTKVAGKGVGLLSQVLMGTSPIFLMLSGSLMSHTLSLFLVMAFALAWTDLFATKRANPQDAAVPAWMPLITAGLGLGLLALTRPLTAFAATLPFFLHGCVLLLRGEARARRVLPTVLLLAALLAALLPLWQLVLTGDPFQNPYTLWWEYDRLGFGPGKGRAQGGHSLRWARINTRFSLRAGVHDLFGWPHLSWLFLPFGLLALRRKRDAWLLFAVTPSLVVVYAAYWIGAWLLGPRYYFEALPGLALVSAAGVSWLAGWGQQHALWGRLRRPALGATLLILLCLNLLFYLPARVGGLRGLYAIEGEDRRPLQGAELEGALVFVHSERWMEYGALLTLTPPFADSDLLLAWSRTPAADQSVSESFPRRRVYHYYPQEKGLYRQPRTETGFPPTPRRGSQRVHIFPPPDGGLPLRRDFDRISPTKL